MAGDFSANAPVPARPAVFSANGAAHTSPGQRPGYASSFHQALTGRHHRCLAPSGLGMFLDIKPRALPWAIAVGPFGAGRCRIVARAHCFSRNAAEGESPGQRPGSASPFHQALTGRHNRCLAPSGLGMFLDIEPRALPWAGISRPFGAAEGGLGYGG